MTVASYNFRSPLSPRQAPVPGAIATDALRGVRFHRLTESQCIAHVLDSLDAGRGGWVVTANADILRQCVKVATTGELLRGADLFIADGMPVVWASRLQGTPLPERVAGSSLITTLT